MPGQPSADRPTCRETTKAGKPCRNRAAAGSQTCGAHGGGKPVGAPYKLNAHTLAIITEAVATGATYEIAAQAAGIHRDTLRQWRETGTQDLEAGRSTPQSDLVVALRDARAQGEVELIRKIRAHGESDWRPLAWILERRAPERWAQRATLDVDVHERAAPRTVTPLEPDKRAVILDLLRTATAPPAGLEAPTEGRTP